MAQAVHAQAPPAAAKSPVTPSQALAQPYALSLTASPAGGYFAWIENREGRRNLFVGSAGEAARQLTHDDADDGVDIGDLAWSDDGATIAYVRGGGPTLWAQALEPADAPPRSLGVGTSPHLLPDGRLLFLRSGQVWVAAGRFGAPALAACQPRAQDLCARMQGRPASDAEVTHGATVLGMRVSPDARWIALTQSSSHGQALVLLELATGRVHRVSAPGETNFAVTFSPDSKRMAFLRADSLDRADYLPMRTSRHPWSVQVAEVAGGATRTLYAPHAGAPGSALPYMATGTPPLLWTRDGRLVFASEADGFVHLYAIAADGASKTPVLLTPLLGEVQLPVLSGDGASVIFAANTRTGDAADTTHLWSVPAAGGNAVALSMASDDATPLAAASVLSHAAVSGDGTLAVLASDAARPAHAVIIGAALPPSTGGAPTPPADVLPSPAIVPQAVVFASADGRYEVHAQVFAPAAVGAQRRQIPCGNDKQKGDDSDNLSNGGDKTGGDKSGNGGETTRGKVDNGDDRRHAAILFVHGGPQRQSLLGHPQMDYYSHDFDMNEYLAARGFVVVSVNYRGGTGYGLDFREAEHFGPLGASEYNDVLAARTYLATRADVDPARIGIWGGSYGGFLAGLAVGRNPDLFAAGVGISGVYDWIFGHTDAPWLRLGGRTAHASAVAASPITYAAGWRRPFLLISGARDRDVPVTQTLRMATALRAHDAPVETLILDGEGHDFTRNASWLAAFTRTAAFFERELRPGRCGAGSATAFCPVQNDGKAAAADGARVK